MKIAILRGLWSYLQDPTTWDFIRDEAATHVEWTIAEKALNTTFVGFSDYGRRVYAEILAKLLNRQEPRLVNVTFDKIHGTVFSDPDLTLNDLLLTKIFDADLSVEDVECFCRAWFKQRCDDDLRETTFVGKLVNVTDEKKFDAIFNWYCQNGSGTKNKMLCDLIDSMERRIDIVRIQFLRVCV